MAERALIPNPEDEIPFSNAPNDLRFPKDSKWAWIVCVCSWMTQVLILGILHAFGVFFVEFIEDFKTTKGTAAWVGSVAYGLSMAVGPFVSMLVEKFGRRPVMMAGGTLCAVAILSSSFVTSFSTLFFSFSVIYGIGAGMAITPTMTIGQEYFDKYASISVGIMTAGSSTGTLITAPLAQALVRSIGWRNTFRFFSGTCTLTVLCNILIRPINGRQKTPIQKIRASPLRRLMEELKLWKNRVFVVWTAAVTCVMFGYYIPYVHLVSYAVDNGISQEQGSMLVMILGAVTATGRILFGKIVQYGFLDRVHMHQLSMVITGAGTMLLPLITSFGGLAAYVIVIGLVDGCYVVLLPLLTCSLVGSDKAVLAWGFLIGTSSITFTLGPPVAGFMYDAFGSYNVAFHVAGIPVLAGALILFLIPWAQRTSQSSNIIKVISMAQVQDQEEESIVDFTTLSKCSSVFDVEDSPPAQANAVSLNDLDLDALYFSDINQVTVVPKSPGGRRALREVDFALSALHKSDQVLSKMLGGGRKGHVQRREIPSQSTTMRSPSSSAAKGSFRKSDVINITSSSPSNRRTKANSRDSSDKAEKRFDDVGVQADLISVDSQRVSPAYSRRSGVGSGASINPFNPTASVLYQAILALEHQQQLQNASNTMSESGRASMTSGNQPTTPLLEEFVMEQLERLRDTLRSPSRPSEEGCPQSTSSWMQSISGEHQDQAGRSSYLSATSSSRGSNQYAGGNKGQHSIRTEGTQTCQTDEEGRKRPTCVLSPHQQRSATSAQGSSTNTTNQGLRQGTSPVDIPSTSAVPNEDLEVFSMDPLSPYGTPPKDIPRIPPPPPPQSQVAESIGVLTIPPIPELSPNKIVNTEGGCIFTMDPFAPAAGPLASSQLYQRDNITSSPAGKQPPRNPSSETLKVGDGFFKMDDYHGPSACASRLEESNDEFPTSQLDDTLDAAADNTGTIQTGRFTVDTVTLSNDDINDFIPTLPPPPSVTRPICGSANQEDFQVYSSHANGLDQSCSNGQYKTNLDLDLQSLDQQAAKDIVQETSNSADIMFDLDPLTLPGETSATTEDVVIISPDDVMFDMDHIDAPADGFDPNEIGDNERGLAVDIALLQGRQSGGFNVQN
ncbi:uncharacterized protein LOC124269203 [Haliotis rubra]|uniref:uncharacterized protein LOC124269203 n=1 Tax=Haliotis rubra TaxID=36100 RepID=UPI001EE633BC|nr:uncharacterized protein LOC124269203 [Haliotis rubra]